MARGTVRTDANDSSFDGLVGIGSVRVRSDLEGHDVSLSGGDGEEGTQVTEHVNVDERSE